MQITVNSNIYLKLVSILLKLNKDLGSPANFSMVLQSMFDRIKIIRKIQLENEKLKEKIEEMNMNMQDLLRLSLSRPTAPIMAMAQSNIQPLSPPSSFYPPTPPKRKKIEKIYHPPETNNVKHDLQIELNQIFDGTIPKPSSIKKLIEQRIPNN
ncbi:MAG: hypothetical protein ACTSWX_08720 [Promethearchaeota archaeon]